MPQEMKVIQWRADDGQTFDSLSKAVAHERNNSDNRRVLGALLRDMGIMHTDTPNAILASSKFGVLVATLVDIQRRHPEAPDGHN